MLVVGLLLPPLCNKTGIVCDVWPEDGIPLWLDTLPEEGGETPMAPVGGVEGFTLSEEEFIFPTVERPER